MKSKLIFILPSLAVIGFLAIKPPAIGTQTGAVIITPEATITPAAQPNLRDFDDDGNGPDHENFDDDDHDDDDEHEGHHRGHHDDDDDDESDEDDDD